jgi:hypothetical protein
MNLKVCLLAPDGEDVSTSFEQLFCDGDELMVILNESPRRAVGLIQVWADGKIIREVKPETSSLLSGDSVTLGPAPERIKATLSNRPPAWQAMKMMANLKP